MANLSVAFVTALDRLAHEPVHELAAVVVDEEHVRRTERLRAELLDGKSPEGEGREHLLSLAAACEDVLCDPDLEWATDPVREPYAALLRRTGQLLDHELPELGVGALVVTHQPAARPITVPDTAAGLFPRLRVVGLGPARGSTRVRVAPWDRLEVDGRPVRVAGLPWLSGPEDVRLERLPGPLGLYHGGPVTERLLPRVPRALEVLDGTGADVAVLPELGCDDALLDAWQRSCRARDPGPSPLRLLLVGSGPVGEPPGNRAVLLSRRTGDVVAVQDKQHGFTMTEDYRQTPPYDALGPGTLAERLGPPLGITCVLTGRHVLAVLVCEDLGRGTTEAADAVELGVDLVLSPTFSPPMLAPEAKKWQHTSADALVSDGAAVVVVNSLAAGRVDPAKGERTTYAVWSDPAGDPGDWLGRVAPRDPADEQPAADPVDDVLTPRVVTLG